MSLAQNVPNPFRSGSSTVFAYDLPVAGPVSISVYSVTGQLLRVLEERTMPAGRHSVTWDGRDKTGRRVSAGIYFVQMKAGSVKVAKTVTMLN